MRNTIISMYQTSHLASLIPTMYSFIQSATQNLDFQSHKQVQDIVFSKFSLKLTTDIIGQAAFGINFGLSQPITTNNQPHNNTQVSDFINQHIYSTTALKMDLSGSISIILGLLIPFLQDPIRVLLNKIPGTMDWKVEKTNKKLSSRLDEIVARRDEEEEKRDLKDFLSLILNTRDSEKASRNLFSKDYVSALAYEHLLAGSATTSFTLSSVVYLVSAHLEVEKKLVQEIDGFGPCDRVPTAYDLQHNFPYLDQASYFCIILFLISV